MLDESSAHLREIIDDASNRLIFIVLLEFHKMGQF
jgi:hypothetical protein